MENVTVPGPLPLLVDVTVKNEALEVAVHAQPVLVVTLIDPVAPTPAMLSEVDPSPYEQVAAGAGAGVGVGDDGVSDLEQATVTPHTTTPSSHPHRVTETSAIETKACRPRLQAGAERRRRV